MNAEDQLVDVPVQFQFKTGAQTRLLVMKPGFYWNPAAGWEAIPENGQPTAAQLFVPQRFAAAGVNLDLWSVMLSIVPSEMADASMRVYTSDVNGTSLTPIGWYGIDPSVLMPSEPDAEPIVISNIVIRGMVCKR